MQLEEFGDYVEAGLPLLEQTDKNRWKLGDLASDFEIKLGRPSDPDAPTLSDLAGAWDVETPRVSEWRSVSRFFPDNVRTYETLRWSHYNEARRKAKGDLDLALALLGKAVQEHMGVRHFKRWLSGIWWEGLIHVDELPARFAACLPPGVKYAWLTLQEPKEDKA